MKGAGGDPFEEGELAGFDLPLLFVGAMAEVRPDERGGCREMPWVEG